MMVSYHAKIHTMSSQWMMMVADSADSFQLLYLHIDHNISILSFRFSVLLR